MPATRRLREQAAAEIAERGITPAEAARGNGMSWPAAHQAFAAAADPLLGQAPAPVAHLGIDEHRRGRPGGGWMRTPGNTSCSRTGDIPASPACPAARGCWGRSRAAPLTTRHTGWRRPPPPGGTRSGSWPSACAPSTPPRCAGCCPARSWWWTCSTLVHLAVKVTGDMRRRVVRGNYGRRGRSGDPEYGIKGLLVAEPGAPVTGPVQQGHDRPGQRSGRAGDRRGLDRQGETPPRPEPARPRHRLPPCERDVRGRLFAFYDWCAQNDDIPELLSLAKTVSRWENEIIAAVLTGITHSVSESLNRLAKLEARLAYGSATP